MLNKNDDTRVWCYWWEWSEEYHLEPAKYDSRFKTLILAVEAQLMKGVRIPHYFREFGKKVVENLFYEGRKIRGGKLRGTERPLKLQVDNWHCIYDLYIRRVDEGDHIGPDSHHYSLMNLTKHPAEIKREEKKHPGIRVIR